MKLDLIIQIAIANLFVQNFVVARFLGLCPFIGLSGSRKNAVGMGIAVSFVMAMASFVTFVVYQYALRPGAPLLVSIPFLRPIAGDGLVDVLKTASYILVIAGLVQFIEMFLKRHIPALYRAMGIYLPLITTNCTVLGVALINTDMPQIGLVGATLQGFFGGLGFMIVMVMMAGIRERLQFLPVPECFKGWPIAFICTGMMSLAFLGFAGMAG